MADAATGSSLGTSLVTPVNFGDPRAERVALRRARVRDTEAYQLERAKARGYTISYKRLVLAYACEGVIVLTSLAGAWLFASLYGGQDPVAFYMMLLAPIAYGVIEFSRVPLAVSIRTQRSLTLRIIAAIGVIGAAFVTIKSVSQLGEIMFRPRLTEAVRTQEALTDARNAQSTINGQIADADAVVKQRVQQLDDAEKRLKAGNTELGALPPQRCYRVTSTTPDGRRTTGTRCSTDPRTEAMKSSLGVAVTDRNAASVRLDDARAVRAKFDRAETDRKASVAEVAHRDAIMRSQLHSFTAMVFGREPDKVTDKEIHSFLFFFVFVPAIGASLASTLLALTSVEMVERDEDGIRLDAASGNYILAPFAEDIVRQAREAAEVQAASSLEAARLAAAQVPPAANAPPAANVPPAANEPAAQPAAPLRVIESGR